jgi:2-polyprenyl-3-methyl-5-hydroxy-6-metoxy-1,4-benzoquinol methylase
MAIDIGRGPLRAATTTTRSTNERLFEAYHTYSRRVTVQDPGARRMLFGSFRRLLKGWLPEDRSAPILDIACGEGSLLCYLRELGYTNLAGCDLSPENVAICHQLGLTFVRQFDALRIAGMPGIGTYGTIFAMDILEHLPKQGAAAFLEQVRGLLLPEGSLIIEAPNMGNLLASLHLHYDLSHEWGLTEKTALDLMLLAGFAPHEVEVRAAWNATTWAGYLREIYLSLLHRLVWLSEQSGRPTIPTQNLLVRATLR